MSCTAETLPISNYPPRMATEILPSCMDKAIVKVEFGDRINLRLESHVVLVATRDKQFHTYLSKAPQKKYIYVTYV